MSEEEKQVKSGETAAADAESKMSRADHHKHLDEKYQDRNRVRDICAHIAVDVIHPML